MEFEKDLQEARKATPNRARVWTVEEISLLIKVWSNNEVLYNTRHTDYYKRDKRSVAMNEIHEALGKIHLVDIIRKMENLRSYFGREIKRLYDSGVPVGATKGQSRWAYFDSLLFLEGHMNQKRATPRSDDTVAICDVDGNYESYGGHDECSMEGLEGELKTESHRESVEAAAKQTKRPKLNDRSKQDVPQPRHQSSQQFPTSHLKETTAVAMPSRASRDFIEIDSCLSPKDSSRLRSIGISPEIHEDMIFAEHIGRTLISITDELLKEDLKLQIQQCLCSTRRKQIAIHQQAQQKRIKSQNSMHNWQRSDQTDQPPSFVSFSSISSPESPIHTVTPQIDREERNHNSKEY
ncbi:uncharacterized protein LOC135680748 [Rhopilema esculentum]|uniref:uncharacterized protein LOC135680748 n=1 Tax=Rhopilema esculentum TaxID=499914 RepID=UPI0031D4BDBD|eukprot:gene12991-3758_t